MDNIKAGTLNTLGILVDSLDLIERTEEALAKSRLSKGLLYIPEGITDVSRDPDDSRYGLPCVVVGGYTIHGPKELLDQVKLIDFKRETSPELQERAEKIRKQIRELTELINSW